jgi:hypothetical protein
MKKYLLSIFTLAFVCLFLQNIHAQEFIPIWPPDKKPNNNGKRSLTVCLTRGSGELLHQGYLFLACLDLKIRNGSVDCPGVDMNVYRTYIMDSSLPGGSMRMASMHLY